MLYRYKNGNTTVGISDRDGTRIMETDDDDFNLEFPVSMDLSIGRRCDGGCAFCYEGATPDGPEANLMDIPFIKTLHPYTEAAINGNSVTHPQLVPFLEQLNDQKVFVNMTVNQKHFLSRQEVIHDLVERGLIKGLGVSLTDPSPEFINLAKQYPNLVVHTIAGVHGADDFTALRDSGLKVLILGYKTKGRGIDYMISHDARIIKNMSWLKNNLKDIMDGWYEVISFDNLALEQLEVKKLLSPDEWESFYQGDEGSLSMFIDLTDRTFGVSSLVPKKEMKPITDDIRTMFAAVKEMAKV